MQASLCATIKQRLLYGQNQKKSSIQQQGIMMANQMLTGPPGSGKTTILAKLKTNLRQTKPMMASELLNCAGAKIIFCKTIFLKENRHRS